MKPIREYRDVDAQRFQETILPLRKPAVLRGLVADWPAVRAGADGPDAAAAYLSRFDRGQPVETLFGAPDIEGRFFYNDRLDGLNFSKKTRTLHSSLERIKASREQDLPRAIYVQSAPVEELLPGFLASNALPLAPEGADTRIWIGNRLTVQTHFDLSENVACVVAGRRRFTLFPPEQTPNLYPGPFEHTPSGPPVSMARLEQPDLDAHPRFADALEAAQVAELEAGDALYIPYLWWHHVASLEGFNVLINTWWNEANPALGSPYDAMLHALLGLRDLPAHQRAAWGAMFDHFVFLRNGDPLAHLPPEIHGMLGAHDDRTRQKIRLMLLETLARQAGLRKGPLT